MGPCVLIFMGLEAELHAAGDLVDRGIGGRLVLAQRLVDGCQHQILEHLDIIGTMPPPAFAVNSFSSSSFCIRRKSCCIFCACFIMLA